MPSRLLYSENIVKGEYRSKRESEFSLLTYIKLPTISHEIMKKVRKSFPRGGEPKTSEPVILIFISIKNRLNVELFRFFIAIFVIEM